jgi:hypothetical protein
MPTFQGLLGPLVQRQNYYWPQQRNTTRHEGAWGRGVIAPTHFLPWHYMGVSVSVTPRPRFSPGEKTPGIHCTGGWVGPRACLDTEARVNILSPLPEIEPRSPGRPVRSQTLY